jgi:Uma2 family endonuclease
MTTAQELRLISVADYLARELASETKHEYRAGNVYAVPEESNLHHMIAGNILGSLHACSQARKCRPLNSATKIRIRLPTEYRFYYPDCSVVRRQNAQDESFQDEPIVVFEVASRKTHRTDSVEKKDAYLTIPSLSVYAIVEQESAQVVVYRRTTTGFVQEVYDEMSGVIPLLDINVELPLADVYSGVEFGPEFTSKDE